MQRDTDLTFKDIHGAPNAILKNIEEISKHATDPVAGAPVLDLRFLTYDNLSRSDPVLHLTERGENTGETNYVAVSYTWQKFDPVDDTVVIPRYKISAGHPPRKPRTQNSVLHRAVQFATAYDIPFIWIDQDCVDQQDSADIERHLHIIHEIFYQSRYAIGLLSFHIHNESYVKSLQYILEVECLDELQELEPLRSKDPENDQRLIKAVQLLTTISTDKWFSRTWTLTERLSAPHMRLLLPCEPSLAMKSKSQGTPAEFELSLFRLREIGETLEERQYFTILRKEALSGCQNLLQNDYPLVDTVSRMRDLLLHNFLVEFKVPPWRQALKVRHILAIFSHIEQSDNTVLSDRLLILGYLCGFSRRLRTEEMNHYKWSYSTCAFVLLLINGWFLHSWGGDDATFFWNHTFKDVLAYGSSWEQQRGNSMKQFQELLERQRGQERVPSDFIEMLQALFSAKHPREEDSAGI